MKFHSITVLFSAILALLWVAESHASERIKLENEESAESSVAASGGGLRLAKNGSKNNAPTARKAPKAGKKGKKKKTKSPSPSASPSLPPTHIKLNEVTMCFGEEPRGLELQGYYETQTGNIIATLDEIEIEEGGEDIYAKVVASTYSFLNAQFMDISCGSPNYYLLSNPAALLNVTVVLRSIHANPAQTIHPFPSDTMSLRFDEQVGLEYDYAVQDKFSTIVAAEQSAGEFYFSNVPSGRYLLQFDFQFLNDVFSLCLNGNDYSFNSDIPAEAFVALGPYVLSYQKVELTSEGECSTTPGRREVRLFASTELLILRKR
jgi:hypothetical protein